MTKNETESLLHHKVAHVFVRCQGIGVFHRNHVVNHDINLDVNHDVNHDVNYKGTPLLGNVVGVCLCWCVNVNERPPKHLPSKQSRRLELDGSRAGDNNKDMTKSTKSIRRRIAHAKKEGQHKNRNKHRKLKKSNNNDNNNNNNNKKKNNNKANHLVSPCNDSMPTCAYSRGGSRNGSSQQ